MEKLGGFTYEFRFPASLEKLEGLAALGLLSSMITYSWPPAMAVPSEREESIIFLQSPVSPHTEAEGLFFMVLVLLFFLR